MTFFANKFFQSFLVLLLGCSFTASAQNGKGLDEPKQLRNADLEDRRRAGEQNGRSVMHWLDCNQPGQTFVDVQPGFFEVNTLPHSGGSYVGMVVRQDETWEGMAQMLRTPLKKGQCYTFSGHLAKSATYISHSRSTGKEENFANPVKLQIWGGNSYCTRKELLDESPLINHEDWKEYNFRFEPKMSHNYILLEVFYRTPSLFLYNGNILIDDLGQITPIPCDEKEIIEEVKNPPIVNILNPERNGTETEDASFSFNAEVGNITSVRQLTFLLNGKGTPVKLNAALGSVTASLQLEPGPNRLKLVAKNKDGTNQESRTVIYSPPAVAAAPKPIFEPINIPALKNRKALKEGSTIPIDNLIFMADSSRIETANYPVLDELFRFLMINEDISVELGGHTNNRCAEQFCNSLSAKRAKSIMDYLVEKGIPIYRMKYKGYGKSNPVANNETRIGRKRNQRVEIKILKMEG